jgi:4-hydroxy-tetrahydrodipicolinate synthase
VLSGVVPPLISPLDHAREPDAAAMAVLVEHVLAGGCSGLFVLGGCGEGAWLTREQRGAVIRAAVRAAAGRAPVLAGCMLPGGAPTLEAVRQAADEGADAIVAGSPYYFGVDEETQRRHLEAVLNAADLPLLLYNIPQSTQHRLSPDLVANLAHERRVLGIKDSAGDFRVFQQLLATKRRRADFKVLQGEESLAAASLLQGADGLVPGLANVMPALLGSLLAAAKAGAAAEATRLQEQVNDLRTLHTHGHWLAALKAACAAIGIGNGVPAAPLVAVTAEQRQAIVSVLRRHGAGVLPGTIPA